MQVKKTSQIIKEKTELINEIDSLNKRINNYQKALFNYKELKAENDYLKSILPIAESINMKTFTVIKRTASCQPFVVISSDENFENVRPGDVVISTDGLFGRVVSKNNKKITVLLATHIHSRIPVISRESKNRAILFGQNCDFLKIKYVTNDNASGEVQECEAKKNFIEGEILETIDTGGFFPQSIPVAKIEKDKTGHIKAKWLCSEGKELFMTILFKK
jgi:rod shape-determining protein MreC